MARARRKAKVHALHGILPPNTGQAVPAVVDYLKDLLEQAKRGEIVAVAVAAVDGGGFPMNKWEGGAADRNLLMAAVLYLQFRMAEARNSE